MEKKDAVHPTKRPKVAGSVAQDDLIMGTNNSSIVSKRSVERLYFSDEAPFFRYFVKKPQRRSPLINRGYWLRMKAIDHVVRLFLEKTSSKRKVVINLGCGYDPLPWQCLARYPTSCDRTTFVDVDYKDLMAKKRKTVQETPELSSMLTNVELLEADGLMFRSDQYLQIGCDLRDSQLLDKLVTQALDVEECLVLLVAEVSITYMDSAYSDAVIRWASNLPSAQFCLLEQLLPDGEGHPFAATMMSHFEKLNTRLRSVQKYPTVDAQNRRFQQLGWTSISTRNLWELWASSDFLSPSERKSLDIIEPFDEWEEFALFGCHYFLLVADNGGIKAASRHSSTQKEIEVEKPSSYELPILSEELDIVFTQHPKGCGCARFGAVLPLRSSIKKQLRFGNHAGMGLNTRTDSFDVFALSENAKLGVDSELQLPPIRPSSRMCHTITDMEDGTSLLVGGRASPDKGIMDCWVYHKWVGIWEPVESLPYPLYRHQAIYLGNGCVLVSTGRINSRDLSKHYLVWSRGLGWVQCRQDGENKPVSTYGSIFSSKLCGSISKKCGLKVGGLSDDAVIQADPWYWELDAYDTKDPILTFFPDNHKSQSQSNDLALSRFGASIVLHQGVTYIIGGIMKDRLLSSQHEVYSLLPKFDRGALEVKGVMLRLSGSIPRPLLIGISAASTGKSLLIMGGSAVCFSFGTFWNKGIYSIQLRGSIDALSKGLWSYSHTVGTNSTILRPEASSKLNIDGAPKFTEVQRVRINECSDFHTIIQAGVPVVLEDLNLGCCNEEWTLQGLRRKIGDERQVVVHRSKDLQMNFKAKNFSYASMRFGDFLDEVERGEKLYLRALSSRNAKEVPTILEDDYPSLATDFKLPDALKYVRDNIHSSPLRISGPVNMWLHYDVMANVLCQIQGEKRMVIFPPTDVTKFDFEPGASSSSYNVFEAIQENSLIGSHPHETTLRKGDVLFIPPLWLHTASPVSSMSVAVNVFFRDLNGGYAAGRDVYGNRDLQAYEKGRQDITRILKSFDELSSNTRNFYLHRLAAEFQQRTNV